MLKLTYRYKNDKSKYVTLIGDPEGVRDLYWQLTHNYKAADGTEIGEIKVHNLDGIEISKRELMCEPYSFSTDLSRLED